MNKVIVSLTSYPKRIGTINQVLDSIITQTILPHKIVLYLSSYEFGNFNDFPDFTKYKEYGFEIHWNEDNIKVHNKWFFAFLEYPDDLVITIDDDILYKNTAIETLLNYHNRFPDCIIARNASAMVCDNGKLGSYNDWFDWFDWKSRINSKNTFPDRVFLGIPRHDLLAKGNGGVLYPAHLMNKIPEIFNKAVFTQLSPYNDDLWLKFMEAYNEIPVVLSEERWTDHVIAEHQLHCLFADHNKDGGNDRQINMLLNKYPNTCKNQPMLESMFRDGAMSMEESKKIMRDIRNGLAKKIQKCGQLLIYGAGDLGRAIYDLLCENNADNVIKTFVVKNVKDNPRQIGEIKVKCYKDFLCSDEKILIALWDVEQVKEVRLQLMKDGVSNDRFLILNESERSILIGE